MDDLIFKLNLKESVDNYCIVETYTGELKFLKKKTFSGPLNSIDILKLDSVNNISSSLMEKIKKLFLDETRQIKKNKYLFSFSALLKFLSITQNLNCIYCTAYDRSLYELDKYDTGELEINNASNNSHTKLSVKTISGETIVINSKAYYRNIFGRTFIFMNNCLYILSEALNISALKGYINNSMSKPDLYQIYYNPEQTSKNEVTNIPVIPVLYISFSDVSVCGKLFFSYNGYEIPCNSVEERIDDKQNSVIYLRDLNYENNSMALMESEGWEKSGRNNFILKNDYLLEVSIDFLMQNNFEILTLDHKKISSSKSASFNISYMIDWFELDVRGRDNQSLIPYIDLKFRKKYIELDNEIILLPNSIWENRRIFEKGDGKICIPKDHIGDIFEISERQDVSMKFDPNEIFNFENIIMPLTSKLDNALRNYQKKGTRWLLYLYKNNFGGCLADDMGLGKTIQAISFVTSLHVSENKCVRVLVIAPKTLLANWMAEFEKFSDEICVNIYHGTKRSVSLEKFEQNGGVLLTTFNTLLNDLSILYEKDFDCMFIDEAQYIKNYKSKTYLAVKKMRIRSKFILSGTPFENNIVELWALMDLINPGFLSNKSAFVRKYKDVYDKNIIKRLNAKIKPFVLRRMKKDVLKELPEKTEVKIICDMHDEQRELYESVLASVRTDVSRMPDRFEIKDSSVILEGLLYLRQICCHPLLLKKSINKNNYNESGKFDVFKLKIDELQSNKEKVVVFSQFTTMLKLMKKWADKQKYRTFYLDGAVVNRQDVVDEFECSDEGIFFISLKAGGVGLNIVSCQYAIIYDPWWNPAVENQAADRIYRIGQKENVFIYHLITSNSVEMKIEDLKSTKKEIADNLLIGTDTTHRMSMNDIKKLIEE